MRPQSSWSPSSPVHAQRLPQHGGVANEWNPQGGANWVSELRTHPEAPLGTPPRRIRSREAARRRSVPWHAQGVHGVRQPIRLHGLGQTSTSHGVMFRLPHRQPPSAMNARSAERSRSSLTETGWYNAKNYKGNAQLHTGGRHVGPVARLMLEVLIRNTETLAFEFIDAAVRSRHERPQPTSGWSNNWAPSPSFAALANMSQIMNRRYRILRDAGARAGTLSFTIKSGPSDLRFGAGVPSRRPVSVVPLARRGDLRSRQADPSTPKPRPSPSSGTPRAASGGSLPRRPPAPRTPRSPLCPPSPSQASCRYSGSRGLIHSAYDTVRSAFRHEGGRLTTDRGAAFCGGAVNSAPAPAAWSAVVAARSGVATSAPPR